MIKVHKKKYIITGAIISILVACSYFKIINSGKQYKNGKFTESLSLVNQPDTNTNKSPINARDFADQVNYISIASPVIYCANYAVYNAILNWLKAGGNIDNMHKFNISAWQMAGIDNYGNVKITSYYTPVIQARYTRNGEFQYPIYRMPNINKKIRLPSRAEIYAGALSETYVLAYSNSLIDNFIMDVQGSGYINFGDGSKLKLFSYAGKNGYTYRSIGKVLIDRGDIKKENMSMQAILNWVNKHSKAEVIELLKQNPSFVFFKQELSSSALVKGASAVPLIDRASAASDHSIIPFGTTMLAEVPLLDNNGKFYGKYELRLIIALDVGAAINGQHLDIYQGIGKEAGTRAGWYNHYGRVWILNII